MQNQNVKCECVEVTGKTVSKRLIHAFEDSPVGYYNKIGI